MHVVTAKSLENLKLGRQKGTNHLEGIPKTDAHRANTSRAIAEWCRNNPDKVKARGAKRRGENHYLWNGGINKLNAAIRRLNEYRIWAAAIRGRDDKCVVCESTEKLESHHDIPLAELYSTYNITSTEDARACAAFWDIENGKTYCRKCHYQHHGRRYDS